ncbi:MAG: glycosyltransferase family 39 protein [Alphaproteobacteria bacterium]|nr:glycosyltransferase family 39 protein [Alphaproteobacteria bacterium]
MRGTDVAPAAPAGARGVLDRAFAALAQPRTVVGLILAYCLAHFLVRLAVSPVFTLDEAEQMLFAQSLKLGYRFRHPPLITWLVSLTQGAFGLSLPVLSGLKYLIMASGFLAYFAGARAFLEDVRLAGFATFAFFLTYTVGYYPHVDLMHTVLLMSLLAAAFLMLARLVTRDAPLSDYALAGAVVAAGILAKYVFALFPLTAALAVALTPALRARVRPAGALLTAGVALALTAPYFAWTALHDYSLVTLAEDVAGGKAPFFLLGWAEGLSALLGALFVFTLPFSLVFAGLFPRALSPRRLAWALRDDRARVNALVVLLGAGAMALPVFLFGTTDFKARWLHQVLIGFPVLLFLLARAAYPPEAMKPRLTVLAGATILVAALGLGARVAAYEGNAARCRSCWEYQPFDLYAEEIRALGFARGTILVDDMYLGGNLRARFPEARVLAAGQPPEIFPAPRGAGGCLIAWIARSEAMPPALADYARAATGVDAARLGETRALVHALAKAPERTVAIRVVAGSAPESDCR